MLPVCGLLVPLPFLVGVPRSAPSVRWLRRRVPSSLWFRVVPRLGGRVVNGSVVRRFDGSAVWLLGVRWLGVRWLGCSVFSGLVAWCSVARLLGRSGAWCSVVRWLGGSAVRI